jgi:hypothetical protein
MRFFCLFASLLVLNNFANAQVQVYFNKALDYVGRSEAQTEIIEVTDSSYYIISVSCPQIGNHCLLLFMETDINGYFKNISLLQDNIYEYYLSGSSPYKKLNDNNYLSVGTRENPSLNEIEGYIVKYDLNFNIIYIKGFRSDSKILSLGGFAEVEDNSLYLAGAIDTIELDNNDKQYRGIHLIKTDEDGTTLWQKSYFNPNGVGTVFAHGITKTNDDGLLIYGQRSNNNAWGSYYGYVMKTDLNGNKLWEYEVRPQNAPTVIVIYIIPKYWQNIYHKSRVDGK